MLSLFEDALGQEMHEERAIVLSIGSENRMPDLSSGIDWEYVIQKAYEHRVIPHLSRLLETHHGVSEEVRQRVSRIDRVLGLTVKSHVGRLKQLLSAFRRAEIPLLVFKGLPLAQIAYGDVTRRQPGDLDLLVERSRFEEAAEVLFSLDYAADRKRIDEALRRKIGLTFLHVRGSSDLHWTLDDYPFTLKIADEEIWEKSIYVDIGGERVRTMGLEHLPHYLCFHASKHVWARLSWIADISRLMDQDNVSIDWSKCLEQAQAWKTGREVKVALLLASGLMGVQLPDSLRVTMESDSISKRLARLVARRVFDEHTATSRHVYRLGVMERAGEKLSYMMHRAGRTFADKE